MQLDGYLIAAIAISAVCTIFLRALPVVAFGSGRKMPPFLSKLSTRLPATVMAVLVIYCLKGAILDVTGVGISQFAASAVVVATYKWKHNIFLSILSGTVVNMVMIALL